MSDVSHRAREGKGSDPSIARARLKRLVEAASDLAEAWDPILEVESYPPDLPDIRELARALTRWQSDIETGEKLEDTALTPLDLADPAARRALLEDLRDKIKDLAAAAEDATLPLAQRALGRPMARRIILEARDAALKLLRRAELGLG